MKTTTARYAVIRDSRNGMTWYQAKDVGCITRRRSLMWTTTDRASADKMADNEGGTVVDISQW